jgi:hypothetical protein
MNKTAKILINIAVFVVVAFFVWFLVQSQRSHDVTLATMRAEVPFEPRFELHSSFEVDIFQESGIPQEITRFQLHDGRLYILTERSVFIYELGIISWTPAPGTVVPPGVSTMQTTGIYVSSFAINPDARDIAVDMRRNEIYILYTSRIEVYNFEGELIREWEANNSETYFCSIGIAGEHVFASDAGNRVLVHYLYDGEFMRNIVSPNRFVIPSVPSFDVDSFNDTIFVINSGSHLIESYTEHGHFITEFGTPGLEAGSFAGCCNPIFISFTPAGYLITSEKGIPRVSLFTREGEFVEVLLNDRLLSDNPFETRPFETRMCAKGMLFVAGRNRISIFSPINLYFGYAQHTASGDLTVEN